MDLRKLPPSMLLTLGLACGDGKSSDETTTVNACLSPPDPTGMMETGPCLGMEEPLTTTGGDDTLGSTSGSTGTDTGSGGSTFGPCLSPEPPTGSGTDTETDTDTGTGTGTGTGTEGTSGMMGDELPPSRAAALERVLDRGTLPPDVAARLRGTVR
jgi:hypothetical protein